MKTDNLRRLGDVLNDLAAEWLEAGILRGHPRTGTATIEKFHVHPDLAELTITFTLEVCAPIKEVDTMVLDDYDLRANEIMYHCTHTVTIHDT